MASDELESLRALLEEIDRIPPVERREVNFFDVGGAGYLENPTSDLMALFMGSNGVPPWLGKAVLECLMEATPDPTFKLEDIARLQVTAEREVPHVDKDTYTSKRLDIVFSGENFIVGIENKVYASADGNPFHVYTELLEKRGKSKIYKCVLRPTNRSDDVPPDWPVVSYQTLVDKARDLYGRDVASTPISKWHFLYQELLAHLEQLATQNEDPLMEKNREEFVDEHYSTLFKVSDLLEEFSNHVRKLGEIAIHKALGDNGITTGRANWDGRKVFRFLPKIWGGESQVVLVLSKDAKYEVRTYIVRATCPFVDRVKEQFDAIDSSHQLLSSLIKVESWPERNGQDLVLKFSPKEPGLGAAICGLAELALWVNQVAYSESS